MGSVSHRIKHVKMCKNTDFQVYRTISFLFVKGSPSRAGAKYPILKIAFGGIF